MAKKRTPKTCIQPRCRDKTVHYSGYCSACWNWYKRWEGRTVDDVIEHSARMTRISARCEELLPKK